MDNIYLSELITTRLSHDLIGNVGAMANAVELLNEGDEDDKEDISNILNYSSSVLSKRLKFFRLCFGLSNASVKDLSELHEIIANYLSTIGNPNHPINLKLNISTPKIYKFVMPAVMMMADVLVKGGEINVDQGDECLSINVTSPYPVNASKIANITKILEGNDITENISSYAPLYYLISYIDGTKTNIYLNGNTLIIGG